MIALAVFATVAVALVRSATLSVNQARQIEERLEAQWLAENELVELRLIPRDRESGNSVSNDRKLISQGGRDWELEIEVTDTENPYMQRVEVSVFDGMDMSQPVYSLVGFIGQH